MILGTKLIRTGLPLTIIENEAKSKIHLINAKEDKLDVLDLYVPEFFPPHRFEK